MVIVLCTCSCICGKVMAVQLQAMQLRRIVSGQLNVHNVTAFVWLRNLTISFAMVQHLPTFLVQFQVQVLKRVLAHCLCVKCIVCILALLQVM